MNKNIARKLIKAEAMQHMRGNWWKSFLILLAYSFIPMLTLSFLPLRIPMQSELEAAAGNPALLLSLFVPKVITEKTIASFAVTILLYLFLMCPLSVGIHRFFLKVARGEKALFSDAFSPFANIRTVFASIWLNVIILVANLFWAIALLLLPMFAMFMGLYANSNLLFYSALVLLFAALIFFLLWTSRYKFAVYFFADHGKCAFSSFRDSLKLLSGRNGEAITLRISYIVWDLVISYMPALYFVYMPLMTTVYGKYIYYFSGQKTFSVPFEFSAGKEE